MSMIWAVKQLLVPCNYLRIKHGHRLFESKAVYDFILPSIMTAMTWLSFFILREPLSVFKRQDTFSSVSSLLAILVGFYMAALAAVATFNRSEIDLPLKGDDATLRYRDPDEGIVIVRTLSYRQFISYLFGYAAFLSFVLYVALLLIKGTWDKLEKFSNNYVGWDRVFDCVFEPLTFAVVIFGSWQLFITSLLGIYFLSERIQSLHQR